MKDKSMLNVEMLTIQCVSSVAEGMRDIRAWKIVKSVIDREIYDTLQYVYEYLSASICHRSFFLFQENHFIRVTTNVNVIGFRSMLIGSVMTRVQSLQKFNDWWFIAPFVQNLNCFRNAFLYKLPSTCRMWRSLHGISFPNLISSFTVDLVTR